jgi:sialidase-1
MLEQKELFVSGEDGYHTYRIPSLLVTEQGTVLAFCEARKNGEGDAGDIDIVLRRSHNHGETWEPFQVIVDDGTNTVGNPCPVQDRETGAIWLLFCRNAEDGHERDILVGKATREVFVMKSEDDGVTWSEPREITKDVQQPNWTWYAIGPCHAIQLKSGRLLAACNHAVFDRETGQSGPYKAHVIYSDNHGENWKIGGVVGENTNECAVSELSDGTVYINMRSYHGRNQRASAWSKDGGLTWSDIVLHEALIEPVCQGSVIEDGQGGILLSNPASIKRENMTVRTSSDGGRTWNLQRELYPGPAAYSDLAITKNGKVLCLYECGEEKSNERITLARYPKG